MADCRHCGQPAGNNRRVCKLCSIEDRHAGAESRRTPLETHDGRSVGAWIRVDGTWHASITFDGYVHEFACEHEFDDFPAEKAVIHHHCVDVDAICDGCRKGLDPESTPPMWEDDDRFVSAAEIRTDGGHPRQPDETVELRIRTDRGNLAGIISTYSIGVAYAPSFGPGEEVLESALDGMNGVYPTEDRLGDIRKWRGRATTPPSRDVDVDLVVLEGDPVTDHGNGDDLDGAEIPITDGGADDAYLGDDGPHRCDLCGLTFLSIDGLANHVCTPYDDDDFRPRPAATVYCGPADPPREWTRGEA